VGNYRTVKVRANASSVICASPTMIKNRIEKLFEFIFKKYNESVDLSSIDRMEFIIKLGSFLFSEFLLIHPYKNCNGRKVVVIKDIVSHIIKSNSSRELFAKSVSEKNKTSKKESLVKESKKK
jgi:fido (protein-threonine AMPylation protein)